MHRRTIQPSPRAARILPFIEHFHNAGPGAQIETSGGPLEGGYLTVAVKFDGVPYIFTAPEAWKLALMLEHTIEGYPNNPNVRILPAAIDALRKQADAVDAATAPMSRAGA